MMIENNLVNLTIETDMSTLLAEQSYEYQPIKMMLQKNNCSARSIFMQRPSPMAIFRKAQCSFPPLKIRFPDEVLRQAGSRITDLEVGDPAKKTRISTN
ncbi:MAG: hypothetical protein R2788_05700 [Saprospiraceae bacterium]